jgi:chromosome segregation ATPase
MTAGWKDPVDKERFSVHNILIVSCSVLLCLAVALLIVNAAERDRRLGVQKRFDEAVAVEKELRSRLRDIEIANTELKATIKSQEDRIASFSQRLDEASAGMKEKDIELAKLRARIEDAKAEKEELSRRLEKATEDYLGMKFQLENYVKAREELDKKSKELTEEAGTSLGTIVIKR